ncbi:glucuronate isomerase [Erythrobacter donghaensis]|uniref:glucuronate isomerase n=1 Tax=Erythrobacter donghaensis TaxID=267135 RepID=UPI000A3B84BC|nr:glucuronate isomerase [Erythrobacter donghaensis]
MARLELHEDRLFPSDPATRAIARRLYAGVRGLPIISPHGHTDPAWFAENAPFPDPAALLITPDHYVFRMLYSQGIPLEALGVPGLPGTEGAPVETDPRKVWRLFAAHYHLFHGTPSRLWHDWVYSEVFGLTETLSEATADLYYDAIATQLRQDDFRPRALFDRFNIALIATTEDPLDPLVHHARLQRDGWGRKVITTFRPDNVLDPEYEGFAANVAQLGAITGCDTTTYQGYLDALIDRRAYFKRHGATATDHGHPTATTADLPRAEAEALFARVLAGQGSPQDAEIFRGQLLTEMARMSLEDGLVMQLHPGSSRNHNAQVFARFGRDKGADIPMRTDYVTALHPLLSRHGNDPRFSLIVFTLDESTYARELAPLAGHYPALKLGPAWWFHDSPEGMRRFRENTTETAGFYNTVGFNDDTRAFLSIPARHDVARRMDCAFLARLVAEHRMLEDDAHQVAQDLAYNLVKAAYKLGEPRA